MLNFRKASYWLLAVASLIAIALVALILIQKRISRNESYAVEQMRAIRVAEDSFREYKGRYADRQELVNNGLLNNASANENGYKFDLITDDVGNSYEAHATPQSYRWGGRRSFYVCEDALIRGKDKAGLQADVQDPPLREKVNWPMYD